MRCKNCGFENDDNLYICQNCGSPLYDEEEAAADETVNTQIFSTAELNHAQSSDSPIPNDDAEEEKKKKRTAAIIIVLSVVLVSIIIGIIIGVAKGNSTQPETTDSNASQTQDEITNPIETTKQTTTTTTPTTTTTTTTEPSTEPEKLTVKLTCNEGGEVEGDGSYELGENVTLFARPDDGYEFAGWYDGNTKVSSNTKYQFTITSNTTLKAVFIIVQMEDEPTKEDDDNDVDLLEGDDD